MGSVCKITFLNGKRDFRESILFDCSRRQEYGIILTIGLRSGKSIKTVVLIEVPRN